MLAQLRQLNDAVVISKRTMFEEFDFSLLDDPEFKEDAVREEIVAPILNRLGFAF